MDFLSNVGLCVFNTLKEVAAPATPSAGYANLYVDSSHRLALLDSTGATTFLNNSLMLVSGLRLTTESGVPVSSSGRSSQGTLYLTPFYSGIIWVPDSSGNWVRRSTAQLQLSLSLTLTSGKNYDVFIWDNASTLTLAISSAWTDDTTRADALTTKDGIIVNNGTIGSISAQKGVYLGTIRASGANVTEDSLTKRFVWNYFNRVRRKLLATDTTDSWTYNSTTFRQANGAAGNQVEVIAGQLCDIIRLQAGCLCGNQALNGHVGVGVNSTSTNSADLNHTGATGAFNNALSFYSAVPRVGYSYFAWLEACSSASSKTFYGDNGDATRYQAGIIGEWFC
jgi:hypothetical protein